MRKYSCLDSLENYIFIRRIEVIMDQGTIMEMILGFVGGLALFLYGMREY